jgi:uncharacterized protein|tara:strand:+ start:386 stop:1264 length:879 start_codon:yes stop_codon:yes gene_type:complete
MIETFTLLLASIISLIFLQKRAGLLLFLVSSCFAYFYNIIDFVGIASLVIFSALLYFFHLLNCEKNNFVENKNLRLIKFLLFFLIIIFSTLLIAHKIPGFHNYKMLSDVKLSQGARDFSLWYNFDKGALSFIFLFYYINQFREKINIKNSAKILTLSYLIATPILMICAIKMNYVIFDINKFANIELIIFILIKMIFFTVIVEEIIYRFFAMNYFQDVFLATKYNKILSCIVASLIFSLIHYYGGIIFMILSFIAGLFFGGIYLKTRNIQSAIILHFLTNFTHLLFFSYPSL